jgi:phosphate transport system protein
MERHHFESELQTLKNRLLNMGALVEERVHRAIQALMERNLGSAEEIARTDQEVNELQIEIDERCLRLFALQQPMASDLRLITAAMKINADLERIGDQAVNIAEQAVRVLAHPPLKPIIDLPRMAGIAERMTRESLDAFVRKDATLARAILARDDEVDELKDHVFRVPSHLHDGGPRDHRAGPGADPGEPAPGAHRRPRHQHRRGRHFRGGGEGRAPPPRGGRVTSAGRGQKTDPPARPADGRRRVLLIEDDRDIAEAIAYQLEKAGLQVRLAYTGEEGLEASRRGVDLVLLDLNLPNMDGLEVCRMIRRQSGTAHVPIIIVSARGKRWTGSSASRWERTTTW